MMPQAHQVHSGLKIFVLCFCSWSVLPQASDMAGDLTSLMDQLECLLRGVVPDCAVSNPTPLLKGLIIPLLCLFFSIALLPDK